VCELDSTRPDGRSDWAHSPGEGPPIDYDLPARSVVLLRDAAP
jgi:hypothetical protein